jgi:hypothetical protein
MIEAALPRLFLVSLVAAALVGCGAEQTGQVPVPADTATHPPAWTTYYDEDGRFSIRYPAAWERSAQSLTPILSDPREIVSVGTYHMRPGGELCEHLPANALEDLGPEDAFLSIQERAQPHLDLYSPRPPQFTLGQPTEGFEGVDCVREPGDLISVVAFV